MTILPKFIIFDTNILNICNNSMETSKYFSVLFIKERISSLPETFYGETCNVSFSTANILRNMSHNGEPMLFTPAAAS